ATNASVKKATEDTRLTVTMEVQNFTDPLLPIADSYGDGNTIIPGVAQSLDLGEEAIGWSAAGLPAGMKWDAKTGTLIGAPNKPGRYTIIFTKKVGKETHTVSTTFTVAPFPQLTIQAVLSGGASDDVPFGTVSGAGEYAANKSVKLMAKPAKGFVFSGWFDEAGAPLPGLTVDYRTASVTWPMADSDTTIYASFVPTEEDQSISIYSPQLIYTAGETVDETLSLSSCSLPKASVKGLPSGMKFDAKTLKLSGAPTKPGFYEVTFEATNASVKKATEDTRLTVTMEVLNFDELGIGDVATPVEILAGTTEHNDSRFAQLSGASVAGLPRGLKWDPKNGTLSGVTSTLGNYTVTFTRNKLRTSLTFVVFAQPMAVAMVTPEANQNLLGSASTSRAPSAGTYSLAGTLIGDWAEAVEGDTLSGTITLEANGNAHATLLLGAEADPFSLTGGVENDGSILLFGVCPADFVKPGALIEVLIDNQEVYFTAGDLNGYGLLTEGPFSLTPVSK
ncbi:MAG: Ig domain-containing protein, partial [Candidatus Spyradenecus sp.]